MLEGDPGEKIQREYYQFANEVIGFLSFAMAITCLQFEDPAPPARLAAVFFAIWIVARGRSYRREMNRKRRAGIKPAGADIFLDALSLSLYLLGMVFLLAIALRIVGRSVLSVSWLAW